MICEKVNATRFSHIDSQFTNASSTLTHANGFVFCVPLQADETERNVLIRVTLVILSLVEFDGISFVLTV